MRLAMFPLSTVLFPHQQLPLHVFEPRYRAMVVDCLRDQRPFGVVLIDRGSEVGGGDHRLGVGTIARIEQASPLPDGRWGLLALGTTRIGVDRWLDDDPYPRAEVTVIDPDGDDDALGDADPDPGVLTRATSAVRRARALLSELGEMPPMAPDAPCGTDDVERSWRLCGELPLPALDRQRLLERQGWAGRTALLSELADALCMDLSLLLAEGSPPPDVADDETG